MDFSTIDNDLKDSVRNIGPVLTTAFDAPLSNPTEYAGSENLRAADALDEEEDEEEDDEEGFNDDEDEDEDDDDEDDEDAEEDEEEDDDELRVR